ncbi:hypothetical protein FRB94_012248 [Tulasnella sp. JGI-2019a]|nr:hypothetical protein FRB93_008957 [Tulasnella sp. JGI-2019a]KAG9009301.1 hypothetical protein FRB94_012248 [Tulasnella sp. JGI-2019a]KAG9036550.1 hypothetical protein FRB95_008605 [Tulasnella sp. JGI-2019a]
MTHTSPCVELAWTVLSATLFIFLVSHLYHFDHFQCLKFWELGRQNNGAFKKIMTYSYLLAVPLIFIRSFVMMYIKYNVGYSFIPGHGYIPTPWQLWPEHYQRLIFPAQICFAFAWALEIVSHLEELCFWLFLTNMSPLHTPWFSSWNCWAWAGGSVVGLIVMPVVAVVTRSDPLVNEAYISLVGSIMSTIITLAFFRVIFIFPSFMARVKSEGAGQEVVTRLQTFHSLNLIRVAFRLTFVIAILVLASDGIRPHDVHPINSTALWADFLSLVGGIGCVISSALTLLIFFPRSMPREAGYASRVVSKSNGEKTQDRSFFNSPATESNNPFSDTARAQTTSRTPIIEYKNALWEIEESNAAEAEQYRLPPALRYPPNSTLPGKKIKKSKAPLVHPLVLNYTSPIDLMDVPSDPFAAETGVHIV